ncbi:hypothetical protein N7452_006771 [Penicillium brevicompactum]|uniref:Cell surface protein n=1 Tax=Penicillium brevicompactum TaxID=5074 RepID=A0A9W9QRZ0_PENBR|nr:hypothetical protein N7452_006771 [Penicillium brevicompactum]
MQFVRKAEEALTGKKDESRESTQSSNHGPHSSNLANKLDPRVDSDRDNRAAHTDVDDKHLSTSKDYGSGSTGTTTTAGPHKSSAVNKLDPTVDSTRTVPTGTHGVESGVVGTGTTHGTHVGDTTSHGSTLGSTTHGTKPVTDTGATTYGSSSSNAGPHSSNIANKVDPRVDSDRDNRARHENLGSTNAGPHASNVANKADPRVDSDRDNRALLSGAGTAPALGSTHGTHGPSSTLGSGTGATAAHSGTVGPHDTEIANKLDPRVDSDLDARATHQSLSGIGSGTVTHGSHTRDTASGLAPGQGLAGSSYNTPTGTATGTSGTAATAGPHDSSIANKLDPTVDSHIQADGTQRKI